MPWAGTIGGCAFGGAATTGRAGRDADHRGETNSRNRRGVRAVNGIETCGAQLAKYRVEGYGIFMLPSDGTGVQGSSYEKHGKPCIDMYITPESDPALFLLVLLHEVAHHRYGHCRAWSSQPGWSQELAADQFALKKLAVIMPEEVDRMTEVVKDRLRPWLQEWVDQDLTHHLHLPTLDWLGCKVPKRMRRMLIQRELDMAA